MTRAIRWLSASLGALACVLLGGCFDDDGAEPSPTPSAASTFSPTAAPTATPDDPDARLAREAAEHMGLLLGTAPDLLEVPRIEDVLWLDSCFEVVRPGVECIAGETPGLRVSISLLNQEFELRSDRDFAAPVWASRFEAAGEIEAIDEAEGLLTVRGTGPPFDGALTPGLIQLAIVPGSELLTPLQELPPGTRVRFGHDARPASEVGALVWVASRQGGGFEGLLRVMEHRDLATIRALLRPQPLPCTLELGEGGPPKCWNFVDAPQVEGTEVQAFELYGCAVSWLGEEGAESELEALAPRLLRYTLFEAGPEYQPGGRFRDSAAIAPVEAVAVFDGSAAIGIDDSGRIVALWRGCGAGEPPAAFVPEGQTEFLLPPLAPLVANQPQPAAPVEPPAVTGIDAIDGAIAAVLSRSPSALRAALSFQAVPCSNRNEASFFGPPCPRDQVEGTERQTIVVVACSGANVPDDALAPRLFSVARSDYALNAVLVAPDGYFPAGRHVVVFSLHDPDAPRFRPEALALVLDGRGVVGIREWCNNTLIPAGAGVEFLFGPLHRQPRTES